MTLFEFYFDKIRLIKF